MKFEVFSTCSSELKSALERFIEKVFNKTNDKTSLYVVDETSDEKEIRKFFNEVIKDSKIPPVLFITFSGADTQGSLEFVKSGIERWEVWNPAREVLLKPVLKYLLGIREKE